MGLYWKTEKFRSKEIRGASTFKNWFSNHNPVIQHTSLHITLYKIPTTLFIHSTPPSCLVPFKGLDIMLDQMLVLCISLLNFTLYSHSHFICANFYNFCIFFSGVKLTFICKLFIYNCRFLSFH